MLCVGETTRVFGYVTDQESPFAVYHAELYTHHPHAPSAVVLTISLGDWTEGASPASRHRARLELRPQGSQVVMSFIDFARGEKTEAELGRTVNSDEARRSSSRADYLRVADAVIYGDHRVGRTLGVSDKLS